MRVLIADNEEKRAAALKTVLEKNGFAVDLARSAEALEYLRLSVYDGAILGADGLRILSAARREGLGLPMMLLGEHRAVEDCVLSLEAGADDFLGRPFASREFVARVRALVRRNVHYTGRVLTCGNASLDCGTCELRCGGKCIRLSGREFRLCELFFENPDYLFPTERLMDRVWGQDSKANIDVVWTYIGFLRRSLREAGADVGIRTVRGAGYILSAGARR